MKDKPRDVVRKYFFTLNHLETKISIDRNEILLSLIAIIFALPIMLHKAYTTYCATKSLNYTLPFEMVASVFTGLAHIVCVIFTPKQPSIFSDTDSISSTGSLEVKTLDNHVRDNFESFNIFLNRKTARNGLTIDILLVIFSTIFAAPILIIDDIKRKQNLFQTPKKIFKSLITGPLYLLLELAKIPLICLETIERNWPRDKYTINVISLCIAFAILAIVILSGYFNLANSMPLNIGLISWCILTALCLKLNSDTYQPLAIPFSARIIFACITVITPFFGIYISKSNIALMILLAITPLLCMAPVISRKYFEFKSEAHENLSFTKEFYQTNFTKEKITSASLL